MKSVAFIGIDGAGKTTLIEKVMKKFEQEGVRCKFVYMGLGRDIKIPFFGKLMSIYGRLRYKNKQKVKDGKVWDGERDNYRIRSFPWLSIQFLEFWVRYLKAKRLKNGNVFFDRYFYDGLVFAEGRNFEFFRRFIPKPDLCFLVCAPVDVILKRKKEANKKNIEEFYRKIDLVGEHFKIIKIDNTRRIDIVVEDIFNRIKNGKSKTDF